MAIKVAIRGRPLLPAEKEGDSTAHCIDYSLDGKSVTVAEEKFFTLDKCFNEHISQKDVFLEFISPLINKFLEGENCSVLAYGQTGSGKTYTMGSDYTGPFTTISDNTGIIPRLLENLFEYIRTEPDPITLKMSFLEVLNDSVYDILSNVKNNLVIHDVGNNVKILNLSEVKVDSLQDALAQFSKAVKARTHAFTELNANSSRSHAFFVVKMRRETENSILESKLQLVDLAGSENSRKANTKGDRFVEGININRSLLFLGEVITALCTKRSFIPYRNHVLTRLLRDSLNGTSQTRMIACISPHINNLNETVDTLRYASSARGIPSRTIPRPGKENKFVQQLSLVPPTPLKDFYPVTPSISQIRPNFDTKYSSVNLGLPLMNSTAVREPPPKFHIPSEEDCFLSPLSEKINSLVDKRISETVERTIQNQRRSSRRPMYTENDFLSPYNMPEQENTVVSEETINKIISPIAKKINHLIERSINQRLSELQNLTHERPKRKSQLSDVTNINRNVNTDFISKTPKQLKSPSHSALDKHEATSILKEAQKLSKTIVTRRRTTMGLTTDLPNPTSMVTTRRRSMLSISAEKPITMERKQSTKRLSILEESPESGSETLRPSKKQKRISEDDLIALESPNAHGHKKNKSSKKNKRRLTSSVDVLEIQKKNAATILKRLNEGSIKDLQVFPAIGPKSAYMIHTYRSMFGNFRSIEDMKNVGLSNGVYQMFLKRNFIALP